MLAEQENPEIYNSSQTNQIPLFQLRTNRSLTKYFLLSIVTFGIYGIVVLSHISSEINYIATKHDHKSTMHYCMIIFLLSGITLGIAPLVWYNNISNRIGTELRVRNLPYEFSAGTFWGWNFFGSLIIVGPFIYIHKLLKAMNFLAADYNQKG